MPAIFLIFALICFSIHWLFRRKNGLDLLLLYLVFFCFGLNRLADSFAHLFYADEIAQLINWPMGSPFQFEVGIANLSFGVLAILSVWMRGNFLLAAIIGNSLWLWGDAVGHIVNMVLKGNYASGNAGVYFWADVFVPILIWTFYLLNKNRTTQ